MTDVKQGQRKYDWIVARLNEGKTVYLSTQLARTKLTKKHLPMVRVRDNALEIQSGKRWLDYSYTQIEAQ